MEVDRKLVSSVESIIKSKINEVIKTRYLKNNDIDFNLVNIELSCTSVSAVDKATQVVKQSLVGLPIEDIQERLAIVATLLTKPSQENAQDVSMRIKSLATALSDHPADIAIYSIEQIKKYKKFWPSYSEFYEHIGWRETKRLKLLTSLLNKRLELTALMQ